MSGFVKIYDTILDSSVWGESLSTRVVWVAMLALADQNGNVKASSDGIARRANVPLKQTDHALEVLQAPDQRSKSPDYEGRRVEKIDGGWKILNYEKYREMRTDKQIADAERQKAWRERQKSGECDMSQTSQEVAAKAEADEEAEANTENYTTTAAEPSLSVDGVFETLGLPESDRRAWVAMLDGMTKGLNTSGMKAVPVVVLMEAAIELSMAKGQVTPHRFKIFAGKVVERINRTVQSAKPRPRSDRTSRSIDNITEWLNASEVQDAEVVEGGE